MTLLHLLALLQNEVEMADNLRQEGKFWIVVLVIATLFIGILLYLILLDRRISKLEKK
ncbi:CcmD family protein [Marinilongibacter aquaticus]|uniref:CcmD family protein n=1 Tax=Marinilongibacter aquaticus TaxID=2975157 RepID=UPI0021BDE5F5|nr:CcmD family protein [Marinilongibacter aquaticus]UBM60125.1 CcmD family protein [Marinilongibacter aquaticus]